MASAEPGVGNKTVLEIIAEFRDKWTVHDCDDCGCDKSCESGVFDSEECKVRRKSWRLEFGVEDGEFAGFLDRIEAAEKWNRRAGDAELIGIVEMMRGAFEKILSIKGYGAPWIEAKTIAQKALEIALPDWCHAQNAEPLSNADKARKAPRNCDVGDANEQADRFKEYCQRYTCCSPCPVHAMWDFTKSKRPSCTLYWAQMPYEAANGGAKCQQK